MKTSTRVVAIAAAAALAAASLGAGVANAAQKDDKSVVIYGAFGGDGAKGFKGELASFTARTGIKVTYTNLNDFPSAITVKVKAGQSPDIGIWPQPGALMQMASKLKPLESVVDIKAIKKTLIPGWDSLAAKSGKTYGLPIAANIKSLVWYNPAAFKAAGYAVPKTDAELMALTKKINADGKGYPWCAALPGWPATDWLEEYVLRYGGVKTYQAWAAGTVKYNSAVVKKAANKVADYLLTEGNVNGGGKAAAAAAWDANFKQLHLSGKDKGQCFMIRQGSFILGSFDAAVVAEVKDDNLSRLNVFPLPTPAGATGGTLGGGDLAAAFNTNKDTKAVMSFILSSKLGQSGWANSGFFSSAHKTFPTALYPSKLQQNIGKILATSASFGFDQSDLVPSAVADMEHQQLIKWISGDTTLDAAMTAIDASWKK